MGVEMSYFDFVKTVKTFISIRKNYYAFVTFDFGTNNYLNKIKSKTTFLTMKNVKLIFQNPCWLTFCASPF